MPTSIRHILEKLKYFMADDGLYTAVLLISVAVASFGLGRQSVIERGVIEKPIQNVGIITPSGSENIQNPASAIVAVPTTTSEKTEITGKDGEVVASKSGTKYHLPTCPGAKSIKPENLISFTSLAEAEAAGYTPAANCKF